jgi:hypothetical protein
MSNLLMSQREALKWADRLATDEWGRLVWESLAFSGVCALAWLFCIFVLVACLVPQLRRLVHAWTGVYLPWNICVGVYLLTGIAGIFGYPALFSVGALAYLINQAVPVWILEPMADFSNQWLTIVGWFTWS